jgi:flagella basal body P-ring formation protein FlgA
MPRIATVLLLFMLVADPLSAQTGPVPALKHEATISGELVRIGDLVENAGAAAGTAIFRSPDLGETGRVPTDQVLDAVRHHGLIGIDSQGITEVVVIRPGHIIGAKDIAAAIGRALAGRYGLGDARDVAITFDAEARPIHVESSSPTDLQPTRIAYDRRSGRFDMMLEVPGSAVMRGTVLHYAGSAVETRNAAILVHAVARGTVVKAADIVIERRAKADLGDDPCDSEAAVVGLAARRTLRSGQALRSADLMKPELVQRGEAVTLVYETPGIYLTIRGKAMESGAEGDLISVSNGQSKGTLQGIVSGPGRVTIEAAAARREPTALSSVQPEHRGTPSPRTE